MFKIESYITPILLRYVDKYIQNFRPQDSQVSLWGGAATFNNLDLRLDVLEQELQIPFCFVSGHIHELQIRVPWTKITTEPIVITINTIECILKLRGPNNKSEPSPKPKTASKKDEEVEAVPPSYVSNLINKIVNNIKINCNNLILKYVEDDIVLSMNVKLLTFESANAEWKPEYTEFASSLITLRKLITLSDLTVCIDKRNAAGKIDVYLEPILYKCFIEMHLLRIYHTATAKTTSITRLDVCCNRMEFSITEQQVPMAMRILMLLIALQQHDLKYLMEQTSGGEPDSGKYAEVENQESWVGWAWSFVPSLPLSWDDDWNASQEGNKGHTLHIGGYIDMATVTFKVSESSLDHSGYYPQKKMRCTPILTLKLQGCFMETIMHGLTWFNALGGISEVSLIPMGTCTCSFPETDDEESTTVIKYMSIGEELNDNKKDSLFDPESAENLGKRRKYNISWDNHFEENTETTLLTRAPAVAMDYIYQLEIPDDYNLDNISELSNNLEYSNLIEKSLCRFFVSPFSLCLCSGLFHRVSSLKEAASVYDYPAYGINKIDPELKDLHPPSEEDFDALSVFIPSREYNLTVKKPVIEFQLMDHPYFQPKKGYLFRKRKKMSISSMSSKTNTDLPKLTLECDKLQIQFKLPMYPKRLVYTTCQLPNAPVAMFEACHSNVVVGLTGFSSRLIINASKQTVLVMPVNVTYKQKEILKPKYWTKPNIPHTNILFHADCFTITGTKAKMLLAYAIVNSVLKMEDADQLITSNTLIGDATRYYGMALLEFCVESVQYCKITALHTVTHMYSVQSVKAFVIEPPDSAAAAAAGAVDDKETLQVLILSGPESGARSADGKDDGTAAAAAPASAPTSSKQPALFQWLFQCPLNSKVLTHAPIIHFKVSEIQICFDPLLFKWLLYVPRSTGLKTEPQSYESFPRKQKALSEASGSMVEMPRRFGTPHESIHSSSDPTYYMPTSSKKQQSDNERNVDLQEWVYAFLMEWIEVWRVLVIDGRVSKCVLYFPLESLSAVGSRGIEEAVKTAMAKDPDAEFMIVRLPKAVVASRVPAASQAGHFADYLNSFPIVLPKSLWDGEMFSFPWTISVSDFSCYTLQHGKHFNFLNPVSMKATIVLARQVPPKQKREFKLARTGLSEEDATGAKKRVIFNEKVVYDSPSNVNQLSGPSLGVCIHIDTSNACITMSEVQVCVMASVMYGLINVATNLFPATAEKKQAQKSADLNSVLSEHTATTLNSTADSLSDFGSSVKPNSSESTVGSSESVKLTALVQWTSARFRVKILSHDAEDLNSQKQSYQHAPKLKLVFDAEDLMASLDFQNVYLKFKAKIAAANVKHYVLRDGKWNAGPFLGVVMQIREETPEENPLETDDFCSITITRASCEHAYVLWGASRNYKLNEPSRSDDDSAKTIAPIRFMTEIVITLRPIDIILSLVTLRSYYLVVEPLINIPESIVSNKSATETSGGGGASLMTSVNNQTLPLAYFECTGVRIIVPSLELGSKGDVDNMIMFEIRNIKLSPNAVNPICRTPVRPDIYQKAAKKRILLIPGSEVEDRQYQLDFVGIVMKTGSWDEIRPVLLDEGHLGHKLKTMSENPALEWNNLDMKKGPDNVPEQLNTLPVLSRHTLNIVLAPAIVYKSEVVCGHSVEVNFVSDINVTVTMDQIKLASALYVEFCDVFTPILSDHLLRPKILFLYEKSLSSIDLLNEDVEDDEIMDESSDSIIKDSGIYVNDLVSDATSRATKHISTVVPDFESSLYKIKSVDRTAKSAQKFAPMPGSASCDVPFDVLITAGTITFALYEIERPPDCPVVIHRHKPKLETYIPTFLRATPKPAQPVKQETVPNINMKNVFPRHSVMQGIHATADEASGVEDPQSKRIADWRSRIAYTPLTFLRIVQPNVYTSQVQLGNTMQISVFDVSLRINGPEYPAINKIPSALEDYAIVILETKLGEVNPDTGVPPAFFTFKVSNGFGRTQQSLCVEFARPTRILCALNRWSYILAVKVRVLEGCLAALEKFAASMNPALSATSIAAGGAATLSPNSSAPLTLSARSAPYDTFTKYREIKERLHGVTDLQIKTAQIVISERADSGAEVALSVSALCFALNAQHKPERVKTALDVRSVTLSVRQRDSVPRLLLHPWTCRADVLLFWDLWQSANSDPQIRMSAESDPLVLDIGQEHLKALQVVADELREYRKYFGLDDDGGDDAVRARSSASLAAKTSSTEKEQHYKDDLRAGAYQFVDAVGGEDELPQTYQVKFWSKGTYAMAWKYPQPRALTKVRIFPVPFKLVSNGSGGSTDQQILCHLEYWSECHHAYRPYTHFYLSESEMCHLDLPQTSPQRAIASIWRVIMHRSDEEESAVAMISARALAACMRIDSYFNKSLVPTVTALINISNVNVSLYNHFRPANKFLPDPLKYFRFDGAVPENQCFLTFSLQNTKAYLACWQFASLATDVTTNVRASVLDYSYLTMEPLLQPFNVRVDTCVSDVLAVNVALQPVHVRFGPAIGHTLAVSAQMWNQMQLEERQVAFESQEMVVMTRYVICNNTNVPLKFGQANVDEECKLNPSFCHFYCWRTQRTADALAMHVTVDEPGYSSWSAPFSIDHEGSEVLEMPSDRNLLVFVSVTKLSSTQKQVTFSGQLFFANMMQEIFEMKLVLATAPNKDLEFKTARSHVISRRFPPSMMIDSKEKYSLRLRFYGLEAPWSGDIPLEENAKCLQPWLVKVPLQERGQFLSIWCRVVKQKISMHYTKILVMLWPLFMVRSHLPVSADIVMETPKLKLHLKTSIKGKGELQQLYCPGTIDLTHHVSFETESGNPTAEGYIPLHYGQVDQSKFFQKVPGESIDDILKVLKTMSEDTWPYLEEDFGCIDWLVEEQPVANLQVQYKNACQHSSALCLELLPWCLMVNTLGCRIFLVVNGEKICSLMQHSIVAPPRIEETFHIGLNVDEKMYTSPPLQFAKNDMSESFFMPKITGLLPTQGFVKTSIKSDSTISVLTIDSSVSKDIRIIRVSSTHILTNFMAEPLRVSCFIVQETDANVAFPKNSPEFSFKAEPRLNKIKSGVSICSWRALGDVDTNSDFAMYISVSFDGNHGYSCPVRVDKVLLRRSIYIPFEETTVPATVTIQDYKGQMYVGVHHDMYPQLLIRNCSDAQLCFAQIVSEVDKTVVRDCEHFDWVCCVESEREVYYTMPSVSEKFPEISSQNGNGSGNLFVVAVAPESGSDGAGAFEWSTPISITNFNDQFVRIPRHGEVKVTVTCSSHATVVNIESASQVEICARDVRVRLSHASGSVHTTQYFSASSVCQKQHATAAAAAARIGGSGSAQSMRSLSYKSLPETPPLLVQLAQSSQQDYRRVSSVPFLPTLKELSNVSLAKSADNSPSSANSFSSEMLIAPSKLLTVQLYVATISFTLVNDLNKRKEDVAALIVDNLVVVATKDLKTEIVLSASDIQLDNRLYSKGTYDFPVVLINQESHRRDADKALNCFCTDDFRTLIARNAHQDAAAIVTVTVTVETWHDRYTGANVSAVKDVGVRLRAISAYVEDRYATELVAFFDVCSPQNLVLWAKNAPKKSFTASSPTVCVPDVLAWQANVLARPLALRTLSIEPISVCLSVHSSMKMYIALDQSPLTFARFDRKEFITTPYKLGHALTVHFLSGAIFRAGWVVGSLELLGSPGGLARAMGSGLRDFVNLPYRGLVQGPWAFLKGITNGSASLMRHITAGTLHSVTQFASSVARNLDRLSLDEEHLRRTEEQRRNRPNGLAEGLWQGMTSFGVSLLGAVAGIAHHPMQSVITGRATPGGLAAGVGLGLVGVFIKPLGGAAEFLALTGQGLLEGAGWHTLPAPRLSATLFDTEAPDNCVLKFNWKHTSVHSADIMFSIAATAVSASATDYEPVELIVTTRHLIVVNTEADVVQRAVTLSQLEEVTGGVLDRDATLLCYRYLPVQQPAIKADPETEMVEMDPVSRARVADYVKNTVVLARLSSTETSPVHSEMSISSSGSNSLRVDTPVPGAEPLLRFHINPQFRDYFYNLVTLLKRQAENNSFAVL